MSQQTWPQLIESIAPKFNEIANSNKLVTWAEESQFAIQAIQKNDKLAQSAVHTVQNAVINVAAVGLTLNPALGYAYLVPESVKAKDAVGKDIWVQECSLRVSFKGLLKIATDSGSIKWAKAEIVRANDVFTYRGPCEMPTHEMNPFGDRGAVTGVYCIAKTGDSDILVDVMSAAEIAKIRAAAKQDGVWTKWPEEMAKKAIIKRASKQWPKTDKTDRLDRAIAVVNEHEGNDDSTPWQKAQIVVDCISEDQANYLRSALTVAGVTEDQFCAHKKILIGSILELPAARYEGAMAWLHQIATTNNQPPEAQQ